MCWGMALAAHLVVIMGTQYYDGAHSQGANDYPVTDLLQMMGRASRPDIDDSGRSVQPAQCLQQPEHRSLLTLKGMSSSLPFLQAGPCGAALVSCSAQGPCWHLSVGELLAGWRPIHHQQSVHNQSIRCLFGASSKECPGMQVCADVPHPPQGVLQEVPV